MTCKVPHSHQDYPFMKGVTRPLQVRKPHGGSGATSRQRQWGSCLVPPRALSPAKLTPAGHQRDQHLNCQFSREDKTSCLIFPFPPCLFIWTSNWHFTSGVNQSLLLQQHHLQRNCQKKKKKVLSGRLNTSLVEGIQQRPQDNCCRVFNTTSTNYWGILLHLTNPLFSFLRVFHNAI